VRKTDKDRYLSTWLRRWEESYEKAQELELAEATGIRPALDLIEAMQPISEKFHNYCEGGGGSGEEGPDTKGGRRARINQ